MRVVIQRVTSAQVDVGGATVGAIGHGLLLLVGFEAEDGMADLDWMCGKLTRLRIFDDADGVMNLSVQEIGGEVLAVSQFTLYGDCRKGRRPSFTGAAPPAVAEPLYEAFVRAVRLLGVPVQTGRFAADMQVELVNDGPVTFILDTADG